MQFNKHLPLELSREEQKQAKKDAKKKSGEKTDIKVGLGSSTCITQVKMVLQSLKVLANVGSVRAHPITLCSIDLANQLGKHSLLSVREGSVSLIASCSLELDVKKRVDPGVLAQILMQPTLNNTPHIFKMALKAARSCCEFPNFRTKFIAQVLQNTGLLQELFGVLSLAYVWELTDAIFFIPPVGQAAKNRQRAEAAAKHKELHDGSSPKHGEKEHAGPTGTVNANTAESAKLIEKILSSFHTLLERNIDEGIADGKLHFTGEEYRRRDCGW